MKFIEVIEWGNKRTHLLPLNQICDITFEEPYTVINLTNGKTINSVQTESIIKEMLQFHEVNLVNEDTIHILYKDYDEDELPF